MVVLAAWRSKMSQSQQRGYLNMNNRGLRSQLTNQALTLLQLHNAVRPTKSHKDKEQLSTVAYRRGNCHWDRCRFELKFDIQFKLRPTNMCQQITHDVNALMCFHMSSSFQVHFTALTTCSRWEMTGSLVEICVHTKNRF